MKMQIKTINSLAKVFPMRHPGEEFIVDSISGLLGETLSYQAAYYLEPYDDIKTAIDMKLSVISELRQYITIRKVGLIPSLTPTTEDHDNNVLQTEPGLFPDILEEIDVPVIRIPPGQWRSLWIDVDIPEDIKPGEYRISVILTDSLGNENSSDININVIGQKLPEQELIHTEWFHSDCLADYYEDEAFSEKHWEAVSNFIEAAARRGVNMILTPVFTPPLDTAVGGERTTVQLVDVDKINSEYSFGFEKFRRWVKICLGKGIKYIEIAHLYTQWGAKAAPKIMGYEDGIYKKLFGWETPADSPEYKKFLSAFLPSLIEVLKEMNIAENTFFHISDEPRLEHLDSYKAAYDQVSEILRDFRVIDALSSYEFYKLGIVKKPVPANNHIDPFIENNVKGLWTYYCVSQRHKVSNRFVAMPSARNRIINVQLYKFSIEGFLHWGYNFYNSRFSLTHINPYYITDADGSFPTGDPYLVYPGKSRKPVESIRMMVFFHALQDLRAFKLLEKLRGRDYVMSLIEKDLPEPITFSEYPNDPAYLMNLRERVNEAIKQLSS